MAQFNTTAFRGVTKTFVVTVFDANKQPLMFSPGDKVVLTIKTAVEASDHVLQFEVTSFDDNKAVITLTPTVTKDVDIKATPYRYDIQVLRASGEVQILIEPSDFLFSRSVTDGVV